MRRALLSLAIGLAGAAGVAASGWALQAAALAPPEPADRVAADASVWFHEHRFVVDVFHFEDRRTSGACLRGWVQTASGKKARVSRLSLRPGPHSARLLPTRLAAAAGCSGKLARVLAGAAQSGAHLTVSRGYAAHRPVIALKLSRRKREQLTLFVSPRTYRPLVAVVALGGQEVTARLYLARARPGLLAHFHLLRGVLPRLRA